jgi:Aspartyl protease
MTHMMKNDHAAGGSGRRSFLRRAGLAAATSAALPLLSTAGVARALAAGSAPPSGDPDALFKAGEFAAAERGYVQVLRQDPGNAHAAAQLGYIALLSNQFRSAESYLSEAIRLAPGDMMSKQRLADCFVRQDQLAQAAPLMPPALAAQAAAVTGTPFETYGPQVDRVPFLDVEPLPHIEASVNGLARTFLLDTGAAGLIVNTATATAAGLVAVATAPAMVDGRAISTYLGVLPSLRIGQLELRNVPISWSDAVGADLVLPDGNHPDGTIGTTLFYHFLTTMDYRGRQLTLRRKAAAQQREVQTAAARAGIHPQPLWLAGDHLPCTLGRLNDYGPRVAAIDTGGLARGLDTSVANAQSAGIAIDFDHPTPINGGSVAVYPITADRMSIGDTVARHIPGAAGPTPWEGMTQFDTIGNFTHEFFKPFAVTYDFVGMNLFVG